MARTGRPAHNLPNEQLPRVDIRPLHRRGLLWPGSFTSLNFASWRCRARVDLLAVPGGVLLGTAGGKARVAIVQTPCTFGGSRPWFACPQCLARAAVLYLAGGAWGCRACNAVSYSSQRESAADRARRRLDRLAARLPGGSRPRGMHHETFARLRLQQLDAEERYLEAFAAQLHALIGSKDP